MPIYIVRERIWIPLETVTTTWAPAVLKIYSTSSVMHAIIAFEEYCVFKADQLCATAIGRSGPVTNNLSPRIAQNSSKPPQLAN